MYKKYLLSAASVAALATFMAAPAWAFDDSRWDWDLNAKTDIEVDVDVDIKIDPSGATIVEIDQEFKGDLDAKAVTIGVVNDPIDPDGYWDCGWKGCVYIPGGALDAGVELPNVETSATAVGNVATIESQVSVQADINQSVKDNDWDWSGSQLNATAVTALVVNASVDNAATVAGNVASITLDPEETAPSGLKDEVMADTGHNKPCGFFWPCPPPVDSGDGFDTDNFLMANINQYANFDGSAHAFVGGVFISGYNNFNPAPGTDGADIRNIVTNTATAVGNVATITVLNGALE